MGATGDLLAVLAALRSPMPIRRIAERAGVSPSQAGKLLAGLGDAGLVTAQATGPAILYQLNRDHVLAPAVDQVLAANVEWRRRVAGQVDGWRLPPDAVMLFGSVAAGAARADSDIDLLVVRPDSVPADDETWTTQLADLASAVRRWTGNGVDLLDADQRELSGNQRLLRGLRRDGVVLVGQWREPVKAGH